MPERLTESAPRIVAVASAFPPRRWGQDETAAVLAALFPDEDAAFVGALVSRSGVEQRCGVLAPEEVLDLPGFTERNARYRKEAPELAAAASREALRRAGIAPAQVDAVVDVSCTGVMLPALDVPLSRELGLRPDVFRLPVTESGCAGGAVALRLAGELAAAGRSVLVVAVELASLALVPGDRSRANLVSAVLFGDGAAAAVVAPGGRGPRIVASGSHLLPGTEHAMGFDVGAHGLRMVLSRDLPEMLREGLREVVEAFLLRHGRRIGNVPHHLLHPGGRRILEAYRELFELPEEALRASRECLRCHGNLSSASILAVLELALAAPLRSRSGGALLTSFGPGLSVEMTLLSFDEA